jgi:organic radical activating enzyme
VLQLDDVAKGYLSEIFLSFQGEGLLAGRRQLFLRMSGCHLRCRYCDTPDSLERSATFRVYGHDGETFEGANPLSTADVLSHALPLLELTGGAHGMAVTGGEPLLQADFLAELLADARWPRPRMLETSGTQPDRLAVVLPVVDIVSMDIKLPSNSGEPPFWEAHARFLATARGKAYVKILVDAGTDLDEVERAAALIGREAPGAMVFLQPITGAEGQVDVGANTLHRFFGAAREHIADVRVLPQTHRMLGIR